MNKKDKTKSENVINNNSQKEEKKSTNEHQEFSKTEQDKENDNINNEKTEDVSKDENSNESLIDKLKDELSEAKDEKLRFLAEMENLRKRVDKEKLDSIRFGSINLAKDILSPCDNLIRAIDSLSEEEKQHKGNQGLINGIKMVHQELLTILEKNGVKRIIALDEKFDHNFHQAVMEVETDEKESGIIVQELQVGYTMHNRLLRPSMVGVSKKKPGKAKED